MQTKSIFESFGVESPNVDTRTVPVGAVCKTGKGSNVKEIPFTFEFSTLRRILRNLDKRVPIWAHGPSGCGKTELFCQIGARLNRPVHVISFGEETSLRDLLGMVRIVNNAGQHAEDETKGGVAKAIWHLAKRGLGMETKFEYGALTKAIQEDDAIVVLDEFNMASAGIAAQMNRFLETGTLLIPETGEVIRAAPGVCLVATANTAGGADESGIYVGSQPQNGATRSRFAYMEVSYPEVEKEVEILKNRISDMPVEFYGQVVTLARACRVLVDKGEISLPFTLRNSIRFLETLKELKDSGEAFKDAYYDGLSKIEQATVSEIYFKIFGQKI